MTISATCYYQDPVTKEWKEGGSGEAELNSDSSKHAEIVAYNETMEMLSRKAGGAKVTHFRFEQNAFPCEPCTLKFARESKKGYCFEFVCSKNQGAYAVECGYLPRGDARNYSGATSGTLRIVNGESRGLYGATVFSPQDLNPHL